MHPVLFHIPTPWGSLPIYSYGVMLGLSLMVAWYFIMFWGKKKENLDRELMANCFFVTAVTGLLGGRLLYVFTNLDRFDSLFQWFNFRSGGLVAYGGFLGGALGSWFYLHRRGVPLRVWADLVAPTLGTGLLFTRIGCYLYGCDFGGRLTASAPGWLRDAGSFPRWQQQGPTELLWGEPVQGSPAWIHHVQNYELNTDALASFPVHPTQLYESAAGLVLFGLSLLVWNSRQFRGQVTLVVVAAYSIWRFFIEMVRDDPERGFLLGLSTSQLISLALLPFALGMYLFLAKQKRAGNEPSIPASALAKPQESPKESEGTQNASASSSSSVRKRRKKKNK